MNELPEQDRASEELITSPKLGDGTGVSRPQMPQVEQTMKGDRNQAIGSLSGGTAIGNVQGAVFNISNCNINSMTGAGDIHYQEAPPQISTP